MNTPTTNMKGVLDYAHLQQRRDELLVKLSHNRQERADIEHELREIAREMGSAL